MKTARIDVRVSEVSTMKTARINVRVSEVDKETIKKSRYSYADAIEYFARLLRKNKGIIPDLYLKSLREKLDEVSERKIELEKELERLEMEEDLLKRELERFSGHDEYMREVREAARFVINRLEERNIVSPSELVNDRGEDLIEVASRIYGAPQEEIIDLLSEKGVKVI